MSKNTCLYLRGSTYWLKLTVAGQLIRKSTGSSDLATATEIANKFRVEYEYSILYPNKRKESTSNIMLLSEAINTCYKHKWSANRSGVQSLNQAMYLLSLINDKPVKDINTLTVLNLQSTLRKESLAEPTVNRYLAALRTVLNHYQDIDESYRVPKFKLSKETQNRVITYTVEQEKQILNWFKANGCDEMHDLVVVLIDTGLRLSEATGINQIDVNGKMISEYKNGVVTSYINKGKKVRRVLTSERASSILSNYPRGFRLDKRSAEYYWEKMRKALNLEKGSVLHCLRHTYASRLSEAGVAAKAIQIRLGHASITTTERYTHDSPESEKQCLQVINSLTKA